jgi:Carboxypeptidase regulatory-like domain/Cupin domain
MTRHVWMVSALIILALTGAAGALAAPQAAQAAKPQAPPAAQAVKPQAPPPAAQTVKPQAPPPATQAPKPQAPPAPRTAAPTAARASMLLFVTDGLGAALPDVQVAATGPVTRDGATARDGILKLQALKPGNYRLRFESPEVITLERDVTVKAGPPAEVEVTLDRVPPKPVALPPPPAPAAAPAGAGAPIRPEPNATFEALSLPDWIERNLIGRTDPLKETVVGRTPAATASVVQVRDPLKDRGRTDADEMLYVIAGEGLLRARGREQLLDAGSLVVIPRGVTYSIERRGRNPLIALSIVGK